VNAPVLRPLGVGEIFDVSIKIFRAHAGTLLTLVAIVVVPVAALSALIELSAVPTEEELLTEDPDEEIATLVAAFVVAGLLGLLGSIVATATCFKAIAEAYLGAKPTWQGSLRFVLRRLHSVLWVLFLMSLILIPAFIACILPGIWLGVAYAVAIPALLTEGTKGFKSLKRSYRLVRGRWWPAFVVVILGYLLAGIVAGALTGLAAGLTGFDETDAAAIIANYVATAISDVLTTPFIAAFLVVLYFDLRVRKEAFDLQLLAQQIGVEPPEGLPPVPPAEPVAPASGERPPFWPPPPGWKPSSGPPDE
jgi:hypothetical protein